MVKKKTPLGASVMGLVNETIKASPVRGRVKKTVEEMASVLPEATEKVRKMIEDKKPIVKPKAKPKGKTLVVDIPVDIPEPATPPKKEKRPPKITQRIIHEENSDEDEIIEEVIIKKKKKPIVRRKVIYETDSDDSEEEEEPTPKRKHRVKMANPVDTMTNTEIQREMRKIQMDMLSKSLFGN